MNYHTVKLSGWKMAVADDFPLDFEYSPFSKMPIPNGQRSDFETLTSSKFARVLKCNVLFRAKVYSLIIKQYFHRNFLDILKSLLCRSRARKAFRAGQMLAENGFLVPPAVACGRNFLVTLEIKDSTPIYQLFGKLSPAEKQKMLEQFGQTVGQMHNKGIFHGDLRLGNVLVKSPHRHSERSAAESRNLFDFYFIDNERTRKFGVLPMRLRIKNLVQINMHRDNIDENDRKLFFDAYIAQQIGGIDRHKLAEAVISKTMKRLEKKLTTNESRTF